jgi:hypothetical protein
LVGQLLKGRAGLRWRGTGLRLFIQRGNRRASGAGLNADTRTRNHNGDPAEKGGTAQRELADPGETSSLDDPNVRATRDPGFLRPICRLGEAHMSAFSPPGCGLWH